MKSKCDTFSSYKQTSKVCLVFLDVKLHEDRCDWCIYKEKWHKNMKTVEINYLEASNHQTKYQCCFQMSKCLKKCTNEAFRRSKPKASYSVCISSLKNSKSVVNEGTECIKTQNPSMTDVFRDWIARNNVGVMSLEVKLHELRSG